LISGQIQPHRISGTCSCFGHISVGLGELVHRQEFQNFATYPVLIQLEISWPSNHPCVCCQA